MMRNTRTCGEAIVALLEKYGVEIVFGIPGVHTLELYRGLVGSKIRHVLPRHEQGAGFMADGYARATGKPGVCFLITGPGVTNASTAIGQAYSDSVPMLVISSVNETGKLGKGLGELHEMPDQLKMTSAFTAFSARADRPEQFPVLLAKAFDIFNSGRPRPVHIEVPIDIFEQPVEDAWEASPAKAKLVAHSDAIADAASMLNQAQSPAIIVGGGGIGTEAAVNSLCDKLAAPVATTVAGSGILPASHPLSLGPTLVSTATHNVLRSSDIVLVIGTELASTETWENTYQFDGKMIRLDIDESQFSNSFKADCELLGDAAMTLEVLDKAIPVQASVETMDKRIAEVAVARHAFDLELSIDENLRRRAFEAVVDGLPDDALITADMTQIGYTGHSVFRSETAGRFFNPTGFGTLGYGLPAGIGAQLGAPKKPVVIFVGDGGLQYTLQEMATAKEEGLPIVLILWNNELLQQIHEGFVDHGIEPIAVFPKNPDFQMLAQSFGWETERTDDLAGLADLTKAAYENALRAKVPVMIEIVVNELKYVGA